MCINYVEWRPYYDRCLINVDLPSSISYFVLLLYPSPSEHNTSRNQRRMTETLKHLRRAHEKNPHREGKTEF